MRTDNTDFEDMQTKYKRFYKQLWDLKLPQKIKIAMWKFSWNFLPTLSNMQLRRLAVDASCPRCHGAAECVNHLLRNCHVSEAILSELGFGQIGTNTALGFFDWLMWIFDSSSKVQHSCFVLDHG